MCVGEEERERGRSRLVTNIVRILSSVDDLGLPWIPWMMGKELFSRFGRGSRKFPAIRYTENQTPCTRFRDQNTKDLLDVMRQK